MQEDVWSAGEARGSVADRKLPSVMDLLVETFEDARDNFVDWLMAGVGVFAVVFPLIFLSIGALVAAVFVGMVPGLILEDEGVMALGMMAVYVVGLLLLVVSQMVIMPPLQASLGRAMLEHVRDGENKLGFGAAFSSWREDIFKVLGVFALQTILAMIGLVLCYFPVFLAALVSGFALPAVIVHRLSPVEAMRLSISHTIEHPTWHLGYFGVLFGISMFLAYVPLIGPMISIPFVLAFQLRAYVAVMGDAEVPNGWEPA